jgi:hypothetical protein
VIVVSVKVLDGHDGGFEGGDDLGQFAVELSEALLEGGPLVAPQDAAVHEPWLREGVRDGENGIPGHTEARIDP